MRFSYSFSRSLIFITLTGTIVTLTGCTSLFQSSLGSDLNKGKHKQSPPSSLADSHPPLHKNSRIHSSITNAPDISEFNSEKEASRPEPYPSEKTGIKTVSIDASAEEIDHALALCESAQTFWEQGDLDKALEELDAAYASILSLEEHVAPELNQQKEDLRFMISKRILEIYASRHIVVKGEHNAIPIPLNSYVQREIKRFTGPEKKFFIRSFQRAGQYRPYIVAQLKKAGMPEELSWLPLIESGFKVEALSPARALGLWQFIPSTGYKFGLKRNYYIDERLDPIKSTHAAISYMSELHKIFGDWSTVLAAYNCGEGRVLKTIRRQKINYLDNFWDLYKKLPSETARYVPRFLATLHILNNPDKYNMTLPTGPSPIAFETVTVSKQVKLNDIAKAIAVSPTSLKDLNPELKYALLPPETYELRVPTGYKSKVIASIDHLGITPPRTVQKKYAYHRVKRGETLSSIAQRYRTTPITLAKLNRMSIRGILKVGKSLKVPRSKVKAASGRSKRRVASSRPTTFKKTIKYTVQQGDNLWIIAKKYNTTTKAIQVANKLRGSSLHIGQKLLIPKGRASHCPVKKSKKSAYRVKSGDSPFTIARKYNMTLQRLLALNHLTKNSKIYPGQRLLVE